jgi:hypothetical protein
MNNPHHPTETKPTYQSSSDSLSASNRSARNTGSSQPLAADQELSPTSALIDEEYAPTSLTSNPQPPTKPKPSTWSTIKKHSVEKPTLKHAVTAGVAGFQAGKKEFDQVKNKKPLEMAIPVVVKAVGAGTKEWKKTRARYQAEKATYCRINDVDGVEGNGTVVGIEHAKTGRRKGR